MEHPCCDMMYLTDIMAEFECDVFFPEFDNQVFKLQERYVQKLLKCKSSDGHMFWCKEQKKAGDHERHPFVFCTNLCRDREILQPGFYNCVKDVSEKPLHHLIRSMLLRLRSCCGGINNIADTRFIWVIFEFCFGADSETAGFHLSVSKYKDGHKVSLMSAVFLNAAHSPTNPPGLCSFLVIPN